MLLLVVPKACIKTKLELTSSPVFSLETSGLGKLGVRTRSWARVQ